MKSTLRTVISLLVISALGSAVNAHADQHVEKLQQDAAAIFGVLPKVPTVAADSAAAARIELGRKLYYDTRLSKNHDVSCNTCHLLDAGGVDGQPTSTGHRGQVGGRNSPTTYNAALHIAQFWDGRAEDVEAQAKGPPLNPIEMAMPDAAAVEAVLASIPDYAPLFAAAFPYEDNAISFDNMARAIGGFERGLLTPAPFDAFLAGDTAALDGDQQRGLQTFLAKGCPSCHNGPLVGGAMYRKLGLVRAFDDPDAGRFDVTGDEADRQVFKVPSLRNVTVTAPYFHSGKVATLAEAVRLMGFHQLGLELTDAEIGEIESFLGSLKGQVDDAYIARPDLPASGPTTPAADPN